MHAHPAPTPDDRAFASDDDGEIDLRLYWGVVSRNRWLIIGFSIALTILTSLLVLSMTPVFRATATLLIESKDANVVSVEEIYGIEGANEAYYQTQFEILQSRAIAEDVIRKLNLDTHPEFDPRQKRSTFGIREWLRSLPFIEHKPPTEEGIWYAVVENFRSRIDIAPVPRSQLVQISFDAQDAALAAEIANAIGDAYIRDNLESRMGMTEQAAEWLTGRLDVLRQALRSSEQKLQEFREVNSLVDVSGVKTLSARELDELTAQLVQARRVRADAQNRYEQVRSAPAERLESLSAVLGSKLVQDSKSAQNAADLKIAELSKRYGPKHPKMIAARAEREAAGQGLSEQIVKVTDGFREEYETALANERALEASIRGAKSGVQDISRKEYELQQLQREVDTNTRLYEMFFQRFRETNDADFQAANARFTDRAVTPMEVASPKVTLIVGLTFVSSIVLGIMLAFLKESLDRTIKSAEDVAIRLGTNLLGVLPMMKDRLRKNERSSQVFLDRDQSGFAEAIRTIRTGVVLSALDAPHKVIVVTSSIPGEGKTTLASNISIALGQMEKVLLIDADMRRPSIAKDFNFPPGSPGLSNLVAGTVGVEDCIHHLEEEGIDVITAGVIPPNPLELLSSVRFQNTLADLLQRYDRVVIDSAPAQAVSDALVLSTHAGALIYVVKADSTPYPVAQSGIRRLREVGAPLIGVVLNQVDLERSARYGGYGGYYGYYDAYGYSNNAEGRSKAAA